MEERCRWQYLLPFSRAAFSLVILLGKKKIAIEQAMPLKKLTSPLTVLSYLQSRCVQQLHPDPALILSLQFKWVSRQFWLWRPSVPKSKWWAPSQLHLKSTKSHCTCRESLKFWTSSFFPVHEEDISERKHPGEAPRVPEIRSWHCHTHFSAVNHNLSEFSLSPGKGRLLNV